MIQQPPFTGSNHLGRSGLLSFAFLFVVVGGGNVVVSAQQQSEQQQQQQLISSSITSPSYSSLTTSPSLRGGNHESVGVFEEDGSNAANAAGSSFDPRTVELKPQTSKPVMVVPSGEKKKKPAAVPWTMDECNIVPTVYASETPADIVQEYNLEFRFVAKTAARKYGMYNYGLHTNVVLDPTKDYVTLESNSSEEDYIDFMLWGGNPNQRSYVVKSDIYNDGVVDASDPDRFMEPQVFVSACRHSDGQCIEHQKGARGVTYVAPPDQQQHEDDVTLKTFLEQQRDSDPRLEKQILEVEGDHVFFVTDFFEAFGHSVLDNVPFIGYLRETMILPFDNRKLLLPNPKGMLRRIIEQWDPTFASERVSWIDCPNGCGNEHVRIHNGNFIAMTLTSTNTRHMDYLLGVRRWMNSVVEPEKRQYIIYHTRNDPTALHGRAINLEQETQMLAMLHDYIQRYNRPEKLIYFDGKAPFSEQYNYFHNANIVIGPHGSGLANNLFLRSSTSCQTRPLVLEFLVNRETPEVQMGGMTKTHYRLQNGMPWAEYHHLFYKQPSDGQVTYVNMNEFREALEDMFSKLPPTTHDQGLSSTTPSI